MAIETTSNLQESNKQCDNAKIPIIKLYVGLPNIGVLICINKLPITNMININIFNFVGLKNSL